MTIVQTIYSASIRDDSPASNLRNRWKNVPLFRSLAKEILISIQSRIELPKEVPSIEMSWSGRAIRLLDLRGIDLTGVLIGNVDLSYCCLDLAILNNSTFSRTSLQFSTLIGAELNNVIWREVQASPINSDRANFKSAKIAKSFFMSSSFVGAVFDYAEISESAFSGCDLRHTSDRRTLRRFVDTTGAVFNKNNHWENSISRKNGVLTVRFDEMPRLRIKLPRIIRSKNNEIDFQDVAKKYVRDHHNELLNKRLFIGKIVNCSREGAAKIHILDFEDLAIILQIIDVNLETWCDYGKYVSLKISSRQEPEVNIIPGQYTEKGIFGAIRHKLGSASMRAYEKMEKRYAKNKLKHK